MYRIKQYTGRHMFQIKITTGGSRPIFRQIIDQVRHGVASSELAVGESLPSVRMLAETLVVNHNTVAKAYSELVRDGVLESRHGRGVFVAARKSPFSAAEKKRRFNQAADVFLGEVLVLDYTPEQIQQQLAAKLQKLYSKTTTKDS